VRDIATQHIPRVDTRENLILRVLAYAAFGLGGCAGGAIAGGMCGFFAGIALFESAGDFMMILATPCIIAGAVLGGILGLVIGLVIGRATVLALIL